MFYRACVATIVMFWLLMMTLLTRVEFFSGEAGWLPVPVDYVWKLIFQHDQSSDLALFNQTQRMGTFHLQPRRLPTGTNGTGGPIRLLSGNANLTLNLPGTNTQNVALRGAMELDDRNTVERFELNVGLHELHQKGGGYTIVLDGQPARDHWHYQVRAADGFQKENAGTSAILMDALNLPALGIDPKSVVQMAQQQASMSATTARRGVLHTNGEDIEAYVVTIRHGESLDTTIYVSQLGQILAVKTFGGYSLYDEALTP